MTLPRPQRFASFTLSFVAHLLCLWPACGFFDVKVVALLAVYATAVHALATMDRKGVAARLARGAARLVLTVFYLACGYLAVVFSTSAGWAVPSSVWITAGLILLVSFVPKRWVPARVPWALSLGIIVTASYVGWQRDEAWVRCEDLQRVRTTAGMELLTSTIGSATSCNAGQRLPIGRYPRKVFEALDGARLLFTTQLPRDPGVSFGTHAMDGSVCEMPFADPARVRCVGHGRAHGLVEVPSHDTIIAPITGTTDLGPGHVLVLNRTGPLQIKQTLPFTMPGSNAFYDAAHDSVSLFSDYGDVMARASGHGFTPLPPVPLFAHPSEVRYSEEKKVALVCGQFGFYGLVSEVDTDTYKVKRLDAGALTPLLPMVWGCDWDHTHRYVYVSIPNLGLVGVVDRQTGGLVRQFFVGFGARAVAYDEKRHLVYVGRFPSGEVTAFDETSGHEVRRWFAGRFVRDVRVTPDGDMLLVTSNLGIVRIQLGAETTSQK